MKAEQAQTNDARDGERRAGHRVADIVWRCDNEPGLYKSGGSHDGREYDAGFRPAQVRSPEEKRQQHDRIHSSEADHGGAEEITHVLPQLFSVVREYQNDKAQREDPLDVGDG